MSRFLLGLGSNLGNRRTVLRHATSKVAGLRGCQLLARSRWYETSPIGGPTGQGDFLNGALLLECSSPPHTLALELQAIETQLGRNRAIRWDARAIDLDLLLGGSQVVATPELMIPHPRMSFRKFVLEPAAEIAGFMVDPVSGWTVSRLLAHLVGAPRYVAVTSAEPAIASWLVGELCQELRCLRLEATFPALKGAGDSETPPAVEFSQWALAGLNKFRWEKEPDLLRRLRSAQENLPPVISAFWLDTLVESTQRAQLLETVRPGLVIAVESSAEKKSWGKTKIKKTKSGSTWPELPQASFHEFLNRRGHGPMARIQADDPDLVLQEAIAAIRSAWPCVCLEKAKEESPRH